MREGQFFFLQKGMDFAKGDGINKGEGDGVCGMSFGVCRMGGGVWRRQEAAGATGAFCEKKGLQFKKNQGIVGVVLAADGCLRLYINFVENPQGDFIYD